MSDEEKIAIAIGLKHVGNGLAWLGFWVFLAAAICVFE